MSSKLLLDKATNVERLHYADIGCKQAGSGPSRRHIQGSKIAKLLPSVKYFTVLKNRKFFEKNFFEKITY